jgi:uncharacterized protein (TIGR02145 family)
MRYELKHDKLAIQIYDLASSEAKARRKAENIYQMYQEIGATRLFTEEELEYLTQFQPVLRPRESLTAIIEKSKEALNRARREAEEKEKERLAREKLLIKRIKIRQQRISWIIAVAGIVVGVLFIYAFIQNRRALQNSRLAEEVRQNLERKSLLTEELKEELSAIINSRAVNNPQQAAAYASELNEKLSSIFIDTRDWTLYETVELRGQTWMAENLNYNTEEESWFYDNVPENGQQYGRLYTWEAAREACPDGWRLPSVADWRRLAFLFGGVDSDADDGGAAAYEALFEKGKGNSGFSAVLGGRRLLSRTFTGLDVRGDYWTSTVGTDNSERAWLLSFDGEGRRLTLYEYSKFLGGSCRCIRD